MRPAIALGDVVGEGQHRLVIAVVPPHRHLDADPAPLTGHKDRLGHHRRLVAVEILHELPHTAVVEQLRSLQLGAPVVLEDDLHARVQEGQLPQTRLQRLEDIVEVGKRAVRPVGLGRGKEADLGPFLAGRGIADNAQGLDRVAVLEARVVFLAVPPDAQLQPVRQCVHDRHAHAVETARDLVAVLVELPARMKLGHDDLGGRDAFGRVHVGRNAATVVPHRDRAVGMDPHADKVGVTGQRLVNAVVDDLIDHVMQARAIVRVANIHARSLSHGFQAFENLNGIGAVFCRFLRVVGHARQSFFLWSTYRLSGGQCHANGTRFGGAPLAPRSYS